MTAAALVSLVTLHQPHGAEVTVNPAMVTSLHVPHGRRLLPHGACAIWLTDGRMLTVLEPCQDVKRLFEEVR